MGVRAKFAQLACAAAAFVAAAACGHGGGGGGGTLEPGRDFPADFVFGVATAAEQVEGGHTANDWYQFTHLPRFAALHNGWSGPASDGYARYDEDARWAAGMGLGGYRFSIEWSRVMPTRRTFDPAEIAHYSDVLDANVSRGLRPFVTLDHWTHPIWLLDLEREGECPASPSDANLCGWTNPDAPRAFAEYCGRMAAEYGDRVDHWATFNELNNYLQNAYMVGGFPPARFGIVDIPGQVIPVARGMLEAHARCYDAIRAADTVDADGDGAAALVGMTWATQGLVPADPADPADVAAADLAYYFQHRLFLIAVRSGDLDVDFDGAADETHPEWADRIDWAGVQYYSAAAVVPSTLPPPFTALRCSDNLAAALGDLWLRLLDLAGCPPAPNQDYPLPGYEGTEGRHFGDVHLPEAIVGLLEEFAAQYPDLPLFVTENGFGFRDGDQAGGDRVRARSLVRHLAAIHEATLRGIDVRGYFHWTLMDNWEWNSGPRFRIGLLDVDFATFDRTPNEAYRVYGEIARGRRIADALYAEYGEGPLRDAE